MDRLTAGGLNDVLDQLGPAIARGSVNVISVVAIRDRSPKGWPRRREQVEEFVERAYQRISGDDGLIVALNDIEFLAVHTDRSRLAALHLSSAILKETLTFFVGEAARQDIRLMQVTAFTDGELSVREVDPGSIPQQPEPEWGRIGGQGGDNGPQWDRVRGQGADDGPQWDRVGGTGGDDEARSWQVMGHAPTHTARLTACGLDVEARHTLRFTWNAKNKVVTSFLAETRTEPEFLDSMPPLLASEVARSSLAFAARQVRAGYDCGAPIGIHVPAPLAALSSMAARQSVLHLLRELDPTIRRLIILELTDVPEGVPPSRLSEAVSILSPHVRAVLARAPSVTTNVLNWGRCGLRGVTLDCDHIHIADSLALANLSAFARNALALAPAAVAYSLHSKSLLIGAWSAGFTHLSGAAVGNEMASVAAIRLQPLELYRGSLDVGAAAPAWSSVGLRTSRSPTRNGDD